MHELALQHAPNGKMPEGYVEPPRALPPPPVVFDDDDIMDLSLELHATSLDDPQGEMDDSGLERVPTADPGLDVGFPAL